MTGLDSLIMPSPSRDDWINKLSVLLANQKKAHCEKKLLTIHFIVDLRQKCVGKITNPDKTAVACCLKEN